MGSGRDKAITKHVLIGNVNPGFVSSDFMASIINFMVYDSHERQMFRGYLPWQASACLSIYRNFVVSAFLATDYEWLWFLDSDIGIDNHTLYRLLDAAEAFDSPIMSGIYMSLNNRGEMKPCLYYAGIENGKNTMVQYDEVPEPTLGYGVAEVNGVGAGCLLIRRDVLVSMEKTYGQPKPWFDELIYAGVPYGEDLTFCKRASDLGYPILVNTTTHVSHQKTVKLTVPKTPHELLEPVGASHAS